MTIGDKPTLHVVFNMSAAGGVRQALSRVGRNERVLGFPDDLSFGPINPPSARSRQSWVENELGYDFDEVVQMADQFWVEAMSPGALPIAWVSRHNAAEYSAFLEFVWRQGDSPFGVVDFTGIEYADKGAPLIAARSLGLVPPDQIVEARLFDQQKALRPSEIGAFRDVWRRLRQENAPLRVVDETGLVSAPITHFDDAIVSLASGDWQNGARLVGTTIGNLIEHPPYQCPSDIVLWGRLRALGEAGVLEISGDPSEMRGALARRNWRKMTDREKALVDRLLSRGFPGRDELAAQLRTATVSRIDCDGSLEFRVSGPAANLANGVPVSGRFVDALGDEQGPAVNILLHVADGKLSELEIYKDDGSQIVESPFEIDPMRIDVY